MNEKNEILLIEDNPSDAELTIRALKKSNILNNLTHLKDGEEALDYVFARGKYADRNIADRPKVILLDLKMPKVNGLEVLRELKNDARTKMIPVILLTSSNQNRDIEEGYKLGVNSYIVKPVEFENFLNAIRELGFYWLLLNRPL